MIDWAARAKHRFHTKLTRRLANAQLALARAEADKKVWAGLHAANIGRAKKRIERAVEELQRWEGEHPDE